MRLALAHGLHLGQEEALQRTSMFFVFIFIWSFALFAGITMVWLLAWAIRRGEFNNLRDSSRMIFDEDEPEGMVTDRFPESIKAGGSRR